MPHTPSPRRLVAGHWSVLILIAVAGFFIASACSGSSGPSLDFEKSTAPPEATFIKGGDLPYGQSDDPRIKRSYALFGCSCTFDQVVAHYAEVLPGQGYQRIDTASEPRARFIDNPPKNLFELSVLDPRFHPASVVIQQLPNSDQDKARGYNSAFVITVTHLP